MEVQALTGMLQDPARNARQIVALLTRIQVMDPVWPGFRDVFYARMLRPIPSPNVFKALVREGIMPVLTNKIVLCARLNTESCEGWIGSFALFTLLVPHHENPQSLLLSQVDPIFSALIPLPSFKAACSKYDLEKSVQIMILMTMINMKQPPTSLLSAPPAIIKALVIVWTDLAARPGPSTLRVITKSCDAIAMMDLAIEESTLPAVLGVTYEEFVQSAVCTYDLVKDDTVLQISIARLVIKCIVPRDEVLLREIIRARLHLRVFLMLKIPRDILHYSPSHEYLKFWRQILGYYILHDPLSHDIERFVDEGLVKWAVMDMLLPPPKGHIPATFYYSIALYSPMFLKQLELLTMRNSNIADRVKSDILSALRECLPTIDLRQQGTVEILNKMAMSISPGEGYVPVCENVTCIRTRKADGSILNICSKCKSCCYCSAQCQKQAWKVHKKVCYTPIDYVILD